MLPELRARLFNWFGRSGRHEIQHAALGGEISVFNFVDRSQHAAIKARNVAGQDAWLVTAGLQAALDAAQYKTLAIPGKCLFAVAYPLRIWANTAIRALGRGGQGAALRAMTTGNPWPPYRGVLESRNYAERNGYTEVGWSRAGTTVTIGKTGHGLTDGASYWFDTWVGQPYTEFLDRAYTVTVVNANQFTITTPGTGAAAGTVRYYAAPTGADYWHFGEVVGLRIEIEEFASGNHPDYGMVIAGAGENAWLDRLNVACGRYASYFCVGTPAVFNAGRLHCAEGASGTVDAGLLMGSHPDPTYPATGVFTRTHNSGSINVMEVSGDNFGLDGGANYATTDRGGLVVVTGSQLVGLHSVKAEYCHPPIRVCGGNNSNSKPRVSVLSYRAVCNVGDTNKDFVLITEAGTKPQVFVGAGGAYNYTYLINDRIANGTPVTVATHHDGRPFLYDPTGDHVDSRNSIVLGKTIVASGPYPNDTGELKTRVNGQTNYNAKWVSLYSGTDTHVYYINGSKALSWDGNSGGGYAFYGYNGSATYKFGQFTADRRFQLGASAANDYLGFLGAAPVQQQSVGAAATDAATTQTLANNLRTALINLGLCKT